MNEPEENEEPVEEQPQNKKSESIKVVLIGNSGVGKTCISQRYISNSYSSQEGSTVGASYFQKKLEINGKTVQLDIWDTAGQEKYRSMGRMFYKDAYIVLLIYDITDKKSFKDLKNVWFDELKRSGEKHTVLALVGNKSDRYLEEQVDEDDARKYAEQIGAVFGLVSAKTGDCINELFVNVVKKYLNPDFVTQINIERKNQGKEDSIQLKKKKNNNNNKKKRRRVWC